MVVYTSVIFSILFLFELNSSYVEAVSLILSIQAFKNSLYALIHAMGDLLNTYFSCRYLATSIKDVANLVCSQSDNESGELQ